MATTFCEGLAIPSGGFAPSSALVPLGDRGGSLAQQDVLHSEGLRSSTLPVYVLMISS
jgi:hypothetical protein